MMSKPILFNTQMIQALLDGRKSQTRRPCAMKDVNGKSFYEYGKEAMDAAIRHHSPFGKVGDLLYVRETFRCNGWATDLATIFYKASENKSYTEMCEQFPISNKKPLIVSGNWKPSIHMPRWASRLTLHIKDIRVERLQDISQNDAVSEGWPGTQNDMVSPNSWFTELWNSINNNWDDNPFVWCI